MNIKFNQKQIERETLALVKKLISAKSYSGSEQLVVKIMTDYAKTINGVKVTKDKLGNCILHLKGKHKGKKILFDAHIDTVPVLDEDLPKWKINPFKPQVIGGKLYGRGTADMKSALGAMLVALKYFVKQNGNNFAGDIYIAGVVQEECFEGVAAREISQSINPDIVIIGEASDLNIKVGQRGRAEIVLETYGIPAHSSNPDKGVNAVNSMMKLISKISKIKPTKHNFLEPGIMELTDIISSPYPGKSVLPEKCCVTLDKRLIPGETKKSILEPIKSIIKDLSNKDPKFKAKCYIAKGKATCYTKQIIESDRFFPGWSHDKDLEYVKPIINNLKKYGYNPKITKYDFCTNASHYAGERNIDCFGLGPSSETLAHTINEYVKVSELKDVTIEYNLVMNTLTSN